MRVHEIDRIEELRRLAMMRCQERLDSSKRLPHIDSPTYGVTYSMKSKYGL